MSRKMTASYEPLGASSRRLGSPSRGFLGILLVALELLLPIGSDACGDLPRFQTMKTKGNPSPPFNVGDTVEYECRLGFKHIVLPVDMRTECQADNTWKPLQEACTKKTCSQLGDPVNGQVTYVNGTLEFGSEARYSCHEGFYLLGTKVLYCEINGDNVDWSGNPPQCEKILCQPPKQIPNGDFSSNQKISFEYNEIVTYSCHPPSGTDDYSLVGESQLTCIGHNQWSSNPPECKVVKCDFPVVQNGNIVSGFGTKFKYKSEVTFDCSAGFRLQGSSTIVCEADNTWQPPLPKCIQGTAPPKYPTTTGASGPVPPSAKSTPTSASDSMPTPSTTGRTIFSDESPIKGNGLDKGLIAVIILTVLVGAAVVATCVYKYVYVRERQ